MHLSSAEDYPIRGLKLDTTKDMRTVSHQFIKVGVIFFEVQLELWLMDSLKNQPVHTIVENGPKRKSDVAPMKKLD